MRYFFRNSAIVSVAVFAAALLVGLTSAQEDAEWVSVDATRSVIDLTNKITPLAREAISESADPQGDTPDYPRGDLFEVRFKNETTEDFDRLLSFSFPLLVKSSPWGPNSRTPHVTDFQIFSGQALLEVLPLPGAEVYGLVRLTIPAGEKVVLGFAHEGSTDGAGLYLWQPATFIDFRDYQTWSDGVFLGIITVLLAFSIGGALMAWSRRAFAGLAFLTTAWGFEFVALAGGPWAAGGESLPGHWRPISIALLGLGALALLRGNLKSQVLSQSFRRLILFFASAFVLTIALALFGFDAAMAIARTELLLLGIASVAVLQPRGATAIATNRSVRLGLGALLVTGFVTLVLPLFDWGVAGLLFEPLLHGAFLVSLGLLVFPMVLGVRVVSAEPASVAIDAPVSADVEPPQTTPDILDQDRYALGVAAAHQGLWDWTLDGDRLYLSPSIDGMLGLLAGGLQRSELAWAGRIHSGDVDMYRSALRSYLERGNMSFSLEFRMLHEDGVYRWIQLRATCLPGEDGYAQRCLGVVSDITPAKEVEQRMAREAKSDRLTELPNRQALIDQLTDELTKSASHPSACPALLVIDLDRFKTVNDGLGHGQGDALLQTIARRVETVVGPSDMVARIGSDEFALLLAHGTAETSDEDLHAPEGPKAEELAEYLLDLLSQPVDLEGHEVFPTASIGVAHGQDWHEAAEDLLKDAEIAMLKAKRAGGARFVVYDPQMRGDSGSTLALESDLRRALQRRQIEVHFQPIMDLIDGRIAGFEALIRWRHPAHGLMVPDQFVALAEETDMIIPLGRFTLSMASLQLAQWQKLFPLPDPLFVSVNISGRQLRREDFTSDLAEVLEAAQLKPGTLKLEVTESQILEDPDLAEAHLRAARELGAGIALDDFGTGFSSLTNLQRYPFDTIKVDRSFISTMESREDSPVIVNSIVDLARDLGLEVIAEGLEAEDEAHTLRQMGCRFGQGYVFGAPMTAADAQAFIAHHWKN